MTVMGLQNHARNQVTLLAVSASEDAQDTQNETTKFQIPGKKNLCPQTTGKPWRLTPILHYPTSRVLFV
jgi:hypothetical protein